MPERKVRDAVHGDSGEERPRQGGFNLDLLDHEASLRLIPGRGAVRI
jgi:hypothetical protein